MYDLSRKERLDIDKQQGNSDIPDLLANYSEDPAHRLQTLQEALVLYNRIVKTGGYPEVSEAITIIDAADRKEWAPMTVAVCHARLTLVSNRLR